MIQHTVVTISLLMMHMVGMPGNPLTAHEYARQAPECGLADGYQCLDVKEDIFTQPNKKRQLIPGNYLKAWLVSWQNFQSIDDLDPEQKNLKHYKFGFTENKTQYVILFQALLLPHIKNGKVAGYSSGILGRSTQYWIDKQNMTISKRLFYKH